MAVPECFAGSRVRVWLQDTLDFLSCERSGLLQLLSLAVGATPVFESLHYSPTEASLHYSPTEATGRKPDQNLGECVPALRACSRELKQASMQPKERIPKPNCTLAEMSPMARGQ